MRRWIALGWLLMLGMLPLAAQDVDTEDFPLDVPINFDAMTGDTITDRALYDWWIVRLEEGDTIRAEMQAFDGLVPLLGILDSNREVLTRSDTETRGEADGLVTLEFRAVESGEYRVIASRDGGVEGTSIGSYTLLVSLISTIPTRENFLPEVQFRCGESILTSALTLSFAEDVVPDPNQPEGSPYERYVVTAVGYDTFEPALRATSDTLQAMLDCTQDGRNVPNAQFQIPGQPALTVMDEQRAVQLTAISGDASVALGDVNITLAAVEPSTGRFVMMLEGLRVTNRVVGDQVVLRLGPRARNSQVTVYMIADKNSRLDPFLTVFDEEGTEVAGCDDAGVGLCSDVPSARDLQVIAPEGNVILQGGRFDAGLILQLNGTEPIGLQLGSKGNETLGAYTLVIVGELE